MSGVNEIRSKFLDFFAENGHEIVPSSPLVPRNDPTLMFTNAGMVQFKNVFTGVEKRPYQRATTSQKCVRAGGKHNDLDNVGYTARHLTFFEMLGNFSFGDYFKERAIELAWKLITKEFGLKKDKLLVTVYHDDDEAAGHWKKIAGFSDDRIIRIATSDNFWAMGDTGPCGPCSEIFIDRGEHIWGGPPGSPEEDGDRFLEFWNLVFMQFEQVTKEQRQPLPRPSIDTGLGLERMACILQGVDSVFETDLFRNLIDATASALGRGPQEQTVASFRVIADHLRSSAFLVADGVLPSNEGRGYVLRRIMRRAMRHAQLLGAGEPLDASPGVGAGARDGPGLSGPGACRKADRGNAAAGRNPLPQDAVARPCHPRRKKRRPEERRHVRRRHRVHAVRYLWLPARSDAGRAEVARHQRRPGVVHRRDGTAAREGAGVVVGLGRYRRRERLVPLARKTRRHRISRLRHRERRRRGHRAGEGRQGRRQSQSRRERLDRAEPDAVLCGVRRPGRRHRRADGRGRQVPRVTTRRRRWAICSCMSARWSRAR